jgi:glyoxylase-like metal-dependent hydrolase (beta-lactamase superfamily II)
MNRRSFVMTGVASATSLMASPWMFTQAWAQTAPNLGNPTLPNPGFRKLKLGAMEIIALNDGALRRPLGADFVRNAPLEEVKKSLADQKLPTDYVDVPFTPFLIVSGNDRFLIDTGFADNGPATTGNLLKNLAAAGYKPDDINHVILSHYHGDHINGLRFKNGNLVYPNAKVHVPAPEHAFWTDEAKAAAAPDGLKGAFANVKRALGGLPANQLVKFEPGATIAPGITSIPAFGHTPGHTLFTVTSEGKRFIYVADLTNVPSLFARNPDWAVVFDMDPEMAKQTRRKIFSMIVKEKMIAGGFHFPFPAMGTIQGTGNGYQFTPIA